ncbi:hypothetical protein D2L64_07045 [Micromonospora radicis]|uniref:Uncharacterized protein n=1 Tax=Micromonospora radicis TaxID=1894971 RepID=A0A418MZA4_9ACTN|nr:hypothetical protein D2L64_07045 [Micromonospora radicis]
MVAVVLAGAGSVPAAGAAADCTVDRPDPRRLGAALTADGGPAYAQWLERADVRAGNLAVQLAGHSAFGVDDGKQPISTLVRRGYIGSAVDHETRTVVLVVTPEYRGRAGELARRVQAVAPVSRSAVDVGLRAAVRVGCHSGERLAAADELLTARSWHPDAAKASFGYHLDPNDSRLYVSFDPRYPAAAEAARQALGDVAVVTLAESARTGRLDDGRPHYGGAGVRVGSGTINSNICTTAFTVRRNSDGRRGGVSAGHCFGNGQRIFSSTHFWGDSWGRSDYPAFDLIGVASAGETYANVIHVDPCCPSTRTVTAKRSPVVGDGICLSGMVTRAICGLTVTNLTGQLCDPAGCTPGLMTARRNNDVVVRGGDSGGPVYIRTGTANATAVGSIVGTTDSGRNVVAERMHVIENHLGVTILTS